VCIAKCDGSLQTCGNNRNEAVFGVSHQKFADKRSGQLPPSVNSPRDLQDSTNDLLPGYEMSITERNE